MSHARVAVRLFIAAACAAAGGACLTGCQGAAAAATAVETTKLAASAIQAIPEAVRQAAALFQLNNNVQWGSPEKVFITDANYVLVYPTPAAELQKNRGVPRMIVVNRLDPSGRQLY
ncbi:MAG TPA: hypothetical protein VF796_13565 [Humisphaera sp.]